MCAYWDMLVRCCLSSSSINRYEWFCSFVSSLIRSFSSVQLVLLRRISNTWLISFFFIFMLSFIFVVSVFFVYCFFIFFNFMHGCHLKFHHLILSIPSPYKLTLSKMLGWSSPKRTNKNEPRIILNDWKKLIHSRGVDYSLTLRILAELEMIATTDNFMSHVFPFTAWIMMCENVLDFGVCVYDARIIFKSIPSVCAIVWYGVMVLQPKGSIGCECACACLGFCLMCNLAELSENVFFFLCLFIQFYVGLSL